MTSIGCAPRARKNLLLSSLYEKIQVQILMPVAGKFGDLIPTGSTPQGVQRMSKYTHPSIARFQL
jgi:hypothetical protein